MSQENNDEPNDNLNNDEQNAELNEIEDNQGMPFSFEILNI